MLLNKSPTNQLLIIIGGGDFFLCLGLIESLPRITRHQLS